MKMEKIDKFEKVDDNRDKIEKTNEKLMLFEDSELNQLQDDFEGPEQLATPDPVEIINALIASLVTVVIMSKL